MKKLAMILNYDEDGEGPDHETKMLWLTMIYHSNICFDQGAAGRGEVINEKKYQQKLKMHDVALEALIESFSVVTGWKPVFVEHDGRFVQSETDPTLMVWKDQSCWEFEEVKNG